jgi:hypothetical protein
MENEAIRVRIEVFGQPADAPVVVGFPGRHELLEAIELDFDPLSRDAPLRVENVGRERRGHGQRDLRGNPPGLTGPAQGHIAGAMGGVATFDNVRLWEE